MKKIIFCLLISNALSSDLDFVENHGKSFMYFSTLFRPTTPEMLTPGRGFVSRGEGDRHRFSITLATGTSTKSNEIASYFLPNGKGEMIAGELGSVAAKKEYADVVASYFNVLTSSLWQDGEPDALAKLNEYSFESALCFKPHQTFFGTALTYRYQLSCELDHGYWFEIVLPIVWVRNNLNFTEKIITYGGPDGSDPDTPSGYYANMTQAFAQNDWLFGTIAGPRSKGGFADIQVKLGYTYHDCELYHLASFIGVLISTSNTPTAEFLWEPIYGAQGQFAFMSSFNGGFKIWSNNCTNIFWEIDTCGIYYGANNQTRMLDLKDRPWSRYLWVYPFKNTTYPKQGINYTTQRVEVSQGLSRDLNTAFILNSGNFNFEFGYHVYAKEAERLRFLDECDNIFGVSNQVGVAGIIDYENDTFTKGITKDNATIRLYNQIANDKNYKPLSNEDFDLNSAACPAIFSNTFYFTVSNSWGSCYVNQLLFGASYEFVNDNAVINRWMIWLKWALQF